MRQLLLRVDDELHARITAQAKAQGLSVNTLATRILGMGINPAEFDRKDRIKLQMMELGTLGRRRRRDAPVRGLPENTTAVIERGIEAMRGVGPLADELLARERNL